MLAMCLALVACGDDAPRQRKPGKPLRPRRRSPSSNRLGAKSAAPSLLKPDGWSSLIGLHWIEPGSHYIGSDADNGIRIEIGPKHLGLLDLKGDKCASCLKPVSR